MKGSSFNVFVDDQVLPTGSYLAMRLEGLWAELLDLLQHMLSEWSERRPSAQTVVAHLTALSKAPPRPRGALRPLSLSVSSPTAPQPAANTVNVTPQSAP